MFADKNDLISNNFIIFLFGFWFLQSYFQMLINFKGVLIGQAGIAPESDDAKPDEQVLDLHDDKNSTKQFLISSYKKNICPVLKADMNQDSSFSSAISSSK